MKLQVQQKSIRLSRTIQPFPLRRVLAPNLCLLTLLHSSPSDSPLSLQTRFTCNVPLKAAEWPCACLTTGKVRIEHYKAIFVPWESSQLSVVGAVEHLLDLIENLPSQQKLLKLIFPICVKLGTEQMWGEKNHTSTRISIRAE